MSIRGDLADAVAARLQTVTTANGYATNLGTWWRQWQSTPPTWEQLPVVQASDPVSEVEAPAYGRTRHTLTVTAEVLLPGGTDPADLRTYAADLVTAVGTDPTWGGLAETTRLTGVVLDPGEYQRVSAGVTVGLEIDYETALWGL